MRFHGLIKRGQRFFLGEKIQSIHTGCYMKQSERMSVQDKEAFQARMTNCLMRTEAPMRTWII
ncbi:hypothetical protein BZK31_23785 [Pseudomonas floridensis]|uniref:Uncharacterized protein n=1 Tax=Pseudomonas floridensis TaxID=1958950 RepID=A0A1X0MZX4_9PSED|nr:hypothetical protein BZK31_23785 [Pseudomonas floridensis]